MAQIITTNSGGGSGGGGTSYTAGTGIDITSNVISVDEAVVQTVGNMVTNLTGADDDHYPTAKAVSDAITSAGGGDMLKSVYDTTNIEADAFDYDNFYNTPDLSGYVSGPASSTDEDVAVFDGVTGKIIKDSGVKLSSKLDASALSDTNYGGAWNGDTTHTPTKNAIYTKIHTMDVEIGNKAADNNVVKLSGNQSVGGTKTFTSEIVLPSKTTAATNDGTKPATEAQVKLVADDVATINGMISSNASSSNKLMDKNYIDDSINSVTAYYITKNAQGDQWATYSELSNASTFYSGGVARTPTRNDYTIVLADENYSNATTRYIYNSGWEYQYTVNETALSQAQLDALNSGITSGKVSTYDGYATTISGKQDALTLPATPTQGNLVVRGANNKTIADGGAVPTGVPSGGNNGDVLTNVSGTPTWQAPSGGITKIFTLSSTSDLTTAQAAYDWYVNGGNPILQWSIYYLTLSTYNSTLGLMKFSNIRSNSATTNGAWLNVTGLDIAVSNGSVTGITITQNNINIKTAAPTGVGNETITLVV